MACISSVCIPQEVVDKILGYLWQDLPSLKTASLTCQSFALPCQRQLFSTIEIGRRFEHHHPSAQLLRLVTSSPHVAEYVRSLIVEENHTDVYLPQCLPFFHHLRLIHLNLVGVCQLPSPLMSALAHILQSPSLEFVEFKSFLITSLYSGTSFKHLSLWNPPYVLKAPDPTSLNTSRRNALESLVIFNPYDLQNTVDTILCSATIDISKLRRLHINLYVADIVAQENIHIQRILSVCADTLEEFLFRLPINRIRSYQAISPSSFPLDFGILKSLRRLHVIVDPRHQFPLSFPWLLAVLGTISPLNRIEEITITLSAAVFYRWSEEIQVHIPWPQLAALFISNFQHLRRVLLLVQMLSADVRTLRYRRLRIQKQVDASHPDAARFFVQSGLLEIVNIDEKINFMDPQSFYQPSLLHDYDQW